jgi:hypothetical protein
MLGFKSSNTKKSKRTKTNVWKKLNKEIKTDGKKRFENKCGMWQGTKRISICS